MHQRLKFTVIHYSANLIKVKMRTILLYEPVILYMFANVSAGEIAYF